ncbi:DUF6201 family protein [Pantoea endophytica]
MKIKVVVSYISCIMVFLWWLLLSPVFFFGGFNQVKEVVSLDGKFKVVAYDVIPSTPISIYQSLIENDVFIVMYGAKGEYLGQSSPFEFSDVDGVLGDIVFFPGEPGNADFFSINGVGDYTSGYEIPVDNMKWWSHISSFFR